MVYRSGEFGVSGKKRFVMQNKGSSAYAGNFVKTVLLTNVPQCVLSITYLQFNWLISRLSVAREWARMSTGFRRLRVTDPAGEQASSYVLGLPYSWSVPTIVLEILLHWLVSNACYAFMADGGTSFIKSLASEVNKLHARLLSSPD